MLHNRQWLLRSRPASGVALDNFELRAEDIPEPELAPGQVLVRNAVFVCTATSRNWMNEPGRSHRSIELGTPMRGPGGSEVIRSNDPRFPVGTCLVRLVPWEEYSVLDAGALAQVAVPPPDVTLIEALGLYGLNSCTAYFGLLRCGRPQPGETVVVSAAGGSVGSMVVQIAKIAGCRVIAIAGGRDKCALITRELGADAAIDYKHESVGARLAELCPRGVDVYFDNVGGEILDAVMANIAVKGRVVVCGQVSTYDANAPAAGLRDMMTVIYRSVTIRGFVMTEFDDDVEVARADLRRWKAAGRLPYRDDIRRGFDQLPHAFIGLFKGENLGTLMITS